MTIGRNNEAPAAYALTSTIKRLLDHLTEVDLYSAKDLTHVSHTLDNLREIVKNASPQYSPKLITLLSHRLDNCQASLLNLQNKLGRLDQDLQVIHEKLISILRSISLANTKTKVRFIEAHEPRTLTPTKRLLILFSHQFPTTEVQKLRAQLKEVDAQRVDGKFVSASGEVPGGNDEVCELLGRCLLWSEIILERKGNFPEAFAPTYQILVDIRNKLEKLSLTQAWSLRETDLYDYQRQLDRIDESRVNGNFLDSEGQFAELYVQRVCISMRYDDTQAEGF
jgi:hypothetical protein